MQLAARQRRLEHVAGVHRALGLARADEGVELVDEEDDLPLGGGDLLEHGLQPLLELAAVLGAGHHRAQVQRDQPLVLQALGHVAVDDAPREPLDDGRLAHAGLADEHRVVLGAPAEHLDDAADLLVAADDRVELAGAGRLGEVAPVLLQRLVGVLRLLAGDPPGAAHVLEHGQDPVAGDAGGLERLADGALVLGEREQQVLAGDVLVLERLGLVLGLVEDA